MKNGRIVLSVILIIFAIFYYEGKRKIPELKKNIIIDFENPGKIYKNKKLNYSYDIYKQTGIKKVVIKAYRGRVFIKDSKKTNNVKIKVIKGYTDKVFKMKKFVKNGLFYIGKDIDSNFTGEISYEIEAPEDIDYNIENRYGVITIDGASRVKIDDRYSDIRVKNLKSIIIESGYGDIFIKGVKDDTLINTKYSKIDVSNIGGGVKINTKYGKHINIKEVGKDLTINTKFTPVIADRIGGKIKIINKYCENIDINNSEDIEIEASYSNISVKNSKSLSVKGKQNKIYGKTDLLKVEGKNNRIEGDSNTVFLKGKYDKLNIFVKKNGNIVEEKGHIRLTIDKVSGTFSFDLLSTSLYAKINDTKDTYFIINLNRGKLNSDFLNITTNKNIITGIFGDKKGKNIFELYSKYSDITILKQ